MAASPEFASALLAIGRLLLGGLFVVGGVRHLPILPAIADAMRSRGVPLPQVCLAVGIAFQVLGGTLLVFGIAVAWASLGLVLFTLSASVMFMNFWSLEGEARSMAINGWQSNLAIIGGLSISAAQRLA